MTLPVRFRPTARNEYQEAIHWYEDQDTGAGERFEHAVTSKLKSIRQQPTLYPVVYGDVREAILLRFPYAIYFFADPDEIIVVAIYHHRRDPAVWQSRVEDA